MNAIAAEDSEGSGDRPKRGCNSSGRKENVPYLLPRSKGEIVVGLGRRRRLDSRGRGGRERTIHRSRVAGSQPVV